MKRVNEMIDVEKTVTDIENLEDERENRDRTQHHVGKIAHHGAEKESGVESVLADFFLGSVLNPFLKSIRWLFRAEMKNGVVLFGGFVCLFLRLFFRSRFLGLRLEAG